MTLTHPAPLSPAEQAKAQFGQVRRGGKLAEAEALGLALDARRRERPNDTLNALLTWLTEGLDISISSAYNAAYLSLALDAGFPRHASLMYLYAAGYLLHQTVRPADELRLMDPEAVKQLAAKHKTAQRDANAAALAPAQQATREALTANVPDAPRHPVEQDALNLEALTVIEAKLPAVYRAAVHAAQTGDVGALDELGEATRPLSYIGWGKAHGDCWICGKRPNGTAHDAHHVAYGNHHARRRDGPQKFAYVCRACHIPQPFSHTNTAHSSAYSVGMDPDRLVALMEYDERQRQRWEEFIHAARL